MSDNPSFLDLIRRVRAGEQEAAEELVRRYEPAIRRIARIRLADVHLQHLLDSMDICQSVFTSFFVRAALGQFELERPEQLLNLLVDMSRKKLIDQTRKQGAERRDYRRNQRAILVEEELAARDPNPSQEVAGRELLEEFRKRLHADERRLAEQRVQGLDWAEIAAHHGASPEALRKKLARAVDRVGRELGLEAFSS